MENKTQELNSVEIWQLAFSNALVRIRGELKMNQKNFGIFLGVCRMTISFWELRKVIPFPFVLSRIKTKLHPYLTPEELIIFENGPEKAIPTPTTEATQ